MTFNEFIYNRLYQQYKNDASSDALHQVRKFLDYNGFSMPPPKYDYKEKDITTWKYLDGKVSYHENKKVYYYTNVLNPLFKYGHLV